MKRRAGFGSHPGDENSSQMWLGCKSRTAISRWSRGACERAFRRVIEKADRFWFAPWGRKLKPDVAGMQVAHGDFSLESRGMRAAFRRVIEKADRFWFAPWGQKPKLDAA